MGLKQWLKTRWNGDNWHKNGLNTDKNNMANSSKHKTALHKTTAFEIQTRDKHTVTAPPPPLPHPVHQEQQLPFPASIVTRKKVFFNWPWETLYYWTGTYNPSFLFLCRPMRCLQRSRERKERLIANKNTEVTSTCGCHYFKWKSHPS